MKTICVAAAALLFSLCAAPVMAQEIVDAAPSNLYAVAAGDVAVTAVAQLNDAADAAHASAKVDLYKQLMELNGMSRNIRNVIDNTKTSTRLIVVERAGATALNTQQAATYNQIADSVLKQTETGLIDSIARAQAQSFSADEIQQLIVANSSVAAAKYNAGKFQSPEANAAEIQTYMVDAVIKIIKTYRDSVAG